MVDRLETMEGVLRTSRSRMTESDLAIRSLRDSIVHTECVIIATRKLILRSDLLIERLYKPQEEW